MLNIINVIKKYDTIFIDLDDTIFNYSIAHSIAIEQIKKYYKISTDEYERAKTDIKSRDLVVNHHKKELYFKKICETRKDLDILDALDMHELYTLHFSENLLSDKSMYSALQYAKDNGKKVVGITNFYLIDQLKKLKVSGFINLIDELITSEEFEIEKPHRKLFDKAIELAGSPDISDIIMIGDSIVDDASELGIKYFPYNCSKLLISITGKSGAGKSTISRIVKEELDANIIEGDGYHKYERDHPVWDNLTHYNPDANNLIQLGLDIKDLYHNSNNINVPVYNHSNGKFELPLEFKKNTEDVVIIDGLHSLYPEVTGDYVKIKIFIDNLNSDKQKIDRDVTHRNKKEESVLKSISEREEDYNEYIIIQKEFSNFLIEVNEENFKITIGEDIITEKKVFQGPKDDLHKTLRVIINEIKGNRYN